MDTYPIPMSAIRLAICASCFNTPAISGGLKICSGCKRLAYCSKNCQKNDWVAGHKKICPIFGKANKLSRGVTGEGRSWDVRKDEVAANTEMLVAGLMVQDQLVKANVLRITQLEPTCFHCFRSSQQFPADIKLTPRPKCHIHTFCTTCPQTHPSSTCQTGQHILLDEKAMIKYMRTTGERHVLWPSQGSRKKYTPLSTFTGWYDFYTRAITEGSMFLSEMTQDLRPETNDEIVAGFVNEMRLSTMLSWMPLASIETLEVVIPDLETRKDLELFLIEGQTRDPRQLLVFEEMLHFLPALETLTLEMICLDMPEIIYAQLRPKQRSTTLSCCDVCQSRGRKITVAMRPGTYLQSSGVPDMAAMFEPDFLMDDPPMWNSTIRHLVTAKYPTFMSSLGGDRIGDEVGIIEQIGGRFVKKGEGNKWGPVPPMLGPFEEGLNEYFRPHEKWYLLAGRKA